MATGITATGVQTASRSGSGRSTRAAPTTPRSRADHVPRHPGRRRPCRTTSSTSQFATSSCVSMRSARRSWPPRAAGDGDSLAELAPLASRCATGLVAPARRGGRGARRGRRAVQHDQQSQLLRTRSSFVDAARPGHAAVGRRRLHAEHLEARLGSMANQLGTTGWSVCYSQIHDSVDLRRVGEVDPAAGRKARGTRRRILIRPSLRLLRSTNTTVGPRRASARSTTPAHRPQ